MDKGTDVLKTVEISHFIENKVLYVRKRTDEVPLKLLMLSIIKAAVETSP